MADSVQAERAGSTVPLKLPPIHELFKTLKIIGLVPKWKEFGRYLGIEQHKLEVIEMSVSGQGENKPEHCFPLVLDDWLKGQGKSVTKKTLVEALEENECGEVAKKIDANTKLELGVLCMKLKDCRSKYSVLGTSLGLKKERIKEFECYRGDPAECLIEVLTLYKNDMPPDMMKIYEAVENSGYGTILQALQESRVEADADEEMPDIT